MPVAIDYGPLARKTLCRWMHLGDFSCEYVAAKLGEYLGTRMSPQLVSQWRTGTVHLPLDVVPYLMAIGRPDMWTGTLSRASARLNGEEEVTEDLLTVERHAVRAMADAGELVSEVAGALEDGKIDNEERGRLMPVVRDELLKLEKLLAALSAPRVADGSRR